MKPRITFLVSAYDRPQCLWVSLGSLINQTMENWDAIVLSNHPSAEFCGRNRAVWSAIGDHRINFFDSCDHSIPSWDCYWSAELAVNLGFVTGEYIACPSDDCYYCPEFAEMMLAKADAENLDLVYCDVLYDRRIGGRRSILNVNPWSCSIDKICSIVRTEKWIGYPDKPQDAPGPSICDGLAIERMVALGYRHGKVDQPLVIHN